MTHTEGATRIKLVPTSLPEDATDEESAAWWAQFDFDGDQAVLIFQGEQQFKPGQEVSLTLSTEEPEADDT